MELYIYPCMSNNEGDILTALYECFIMSVKYVMENYWYLSNICDTMENSED